MFFGQNTKDFIFPENLEFIGGIYFTIITITSIGYGDIYPQTALGRMTVIVMICSVLSLFGSHMNDIINLVKRYDYYRRQYWLRNHTIVIPSSNLEVLAEFLFYYIRENPKKKILLVGSFKKKLELKMLMSHPVFNHNITYLSSEEIIDKHSLSYSNMFASDEIFFINDPTALNVTHSDKQTLFLATYLINRELEGKMYLQLSAHDNENLAHIDTSHVDEHGIDFDKSISPTKDVKRLTLKQLGKRLMGDKAGI